MLKLDPSVKGLISVTNIDSSFVIVSSGVPSNDPSLSSPLQHSTLVVLLLMHPKLLTQVISLLYIIILRTIPRVS